MWTGLGWVGLVFLISGSSDFVLAWWPPAFGSPEWEFATVTQSFNGLPILLLGIGLLAAASTAVERRWWGMVATGTSLVLLGWVLLGFAIWVTNVSLALATVPDELRVGVQKAVVKTALQSFVYSAILAYLVLRAWPRGRSLTGRS